MNEIEFRAWDTQLKTYTYSGWGETTFAIFAKRTNCKRYTIEQYSGAKAQKGKKIFAGDIDKEYGVVVFDPEYLGFFCRPNYPDREGEKPLYDCPLFDITSNIHDKEKI